MLELFLLLLLGLPAANADPKVDLGDPPTFTGTQVTEADEAQTAHAGGCEARLGTGGPVQWRFVPTTCADGKRGGAQEGQGIPGADMDTLMTLSYTDLQDGVQRGDTMLPTYVCTNGCENYQSRTVVYRVDAERDGFLIGTVKQGLVDDADWETWLDGIAFDLNA